MASSSASRPQRLQALIAAAAVVAFVCLVAVVDRGNAGDAPTLAARLKQVEDEREIHDLMVQYGRYLDTLDFAGYAQLFAREGEWSGQLSEYATMKGPAQIRAAMEKAFATRTYDPAHITNLHLVSNVRIEVDGDRAKGYSRWTVMSRNERDEPYARVTGHYDDVFIREDGHWKFLSRIAQREIP